MTTINIERRLLERLYLYWLEDADPRELDEFTAQVRAALSATAPEQMPLERDCICHQDLHIDGYSGGAAPEGLYGALWVVVEGVGKKYVLADQSSEPKDMPAPATAPEPSWHDAPTVPGLWVSDFSWMAQKLDRDTVEFYAKNRSIPSRRWYGPIPEDRQ